MAFTIGSGTFTNGSSTVTGVTLTSGTLAYFASGTRMVVGVNPVIQEVEAIAAPTVSTITLRSAWTGTGGTYSFLANQTSEGLRDAVQAIRTNNASLQSFIDSIDTAATANSVAQRTSDGSINAVNVYASGNLGVGTASPSALGKVINVEGGGGGASLALDGGDNFAVMYAGPTADDPTALISNTGFKFATATAKDATGFSEKVRIDSSGNVGIGTSTPTQKLHLYGTSDTGIEITKAGVVAARIQAVTTGLKFGVDLADGNTERMRIDSSGNVFVGSATSLDAAKFLINYNSAPNNALVINDTNSGGGAGAIKFLSGGTVVGSVTTTALATSYNTSSDYRLKQDWQPMDCACDRVMQLKPVNFAWKADGSRVDGFLAHELQEVIPEAVTGEKDETKIEEYEVEPAVYEDVVIPAEYDEGGNEISPERTEQRLVSEAVMGEREVPVYQGIDQSKLTPLLTAALQEALRKIEALEARIEALEG